GYSAGGVDGDEARGGEPRISEETIGAVLIDATADVEPYRLVLALTRAAEQLGVTVRHGEGTGLRRAGGRVTAVVLERGGIPCSPVVLGLGPWGGAAASSSGMPIAVRPPQGHNL